MSKIGRAVKRFETIRIGADNRTISIREDGSEIRNGEDTRDEMRCFGLDGKDIETLFTLLDKKRQDALKFIVMLSLKKDDPTTTDKDYDTADTMDIFNIANTTSRQSGLGELFKINKDDNSEKKTSLQMKRDLSSLENELKALKMVELRKRLAETEQT